MLDFNRCAVRFLVGKSDELARKRTTIVLAKSLFSRSAISLRAHPFGRESALREKLGSERFTPLVWQIGAKTSQYIRTVKVQATYRLLAWDDSTGLR